jgi:uncharacterized membrane protein (DUF485 family)
MLQSNPSDFSWEFVILFGLFVFWVVVRTVYFRWDQSHFKDLEERISRIEQRLAALERKD